MKISNFEKFPALTIEGHTCISGWAAICACITEHIQQNNSSVIAIDTYLGVYANEIEKQLQDILAPVQILRTEKSFLSAAQLHEMIYPFVTDDPVFGFMSGFKLTDFLDPEKLEARQKEIAAVAAGLVIVVGPGASLVAPDATLLIYADMPRWEIQQRFRANRISNLGTENQNDEVSYQYKRAFFVDWRTLDRHKKNIWTAVDYFLDTTVPDQPKMISSATVNYALATAVSRPFRVVPFFDPGPWGGQWLKEVCDLDRSKPNYAWGFDCVPEENSLLFRFGEEVFEMPAINLVFRHPESLLGEEVFNAFRYEFPIRFDFLDTMDGGNLSLQVHPLRAYIKEHFGMAYTQDESYYFMEARDQAFVYLGLKENIAAIEMLAELQQAQEGVQPFDAERFVEKWPVKKHDHILIPAGTVHCSGAESVVLEISATPFIFTFKLWDWGRMGLDGKPRPISLEHGKKVIQWDRTSSWTKANLINQVVPIAAGEGWREEKTGLHEGFFIETRRHWFTGTVPHHTNGMVNVLNLIEGSSILVESPTAAFEPYRIHYAETFIVPAAVGAYTIKPYGESQGKTCATIKAYVRTENLTNYKL
ncbi:class I mannose-6-phosphate isomerase [Pedobacter heparinus]|uniref:class I mannose-6-phosphate isomerase n=1 Tax=Pedobacter heparinus TaxID=984 RepID=UPI00292E8939|nr:class I mannose-6-phosphate isomerase [Pedobacter heparinus]